MGDMKVSMFNEVRMNKFKSFILIAIFIGFVVFLGILFGMYYGNPYSGLVLALFSSLIYVAISYFLGDKMVLAMSGAKEVTKKEYPHLFHAVEGLAIAANIPKPRAYVMESQALNAFATGKNPESASVAVTSGLLKSLNRQELEGVLAHELSHIKNYDTRMMILTAVLVGVIVFMSDFMFRSFLFGRNDNNRNIHPLVIVLSILFAILAPIVGELIKLAVSRRREYLADASGAILTRYPEGLASALEKIKGSNAPLQNASKATAHLYISNPFAKTKQLFGNLFSTHPPIDERIKRLRSM